VPVALPPQLVPHGDIKVDGRVCEPLHPLAQSPFPLTPFRAPKKKEREIRRKNKGVGDFESVASPSLSSHGETRVDPFQGHVVSLARPCEPEVDDGGGAHSLPHA
jgi:hypothetical protein